MQRLSYKVALGGIVSSFCLLAMFLTGIFPVLSFVLPMLSGILLLIIVAEVSTQWAAVTYSAVGLLSMFVTYDKEAALIFIMFFGPYPLIQKYVNSLRSAALRVLFKLILFNVSMVAYFYVNLYVFGLQDLMEAFEDFGKYGSIILLAVMNPFFLMYDKSLNNMKEVYLRFLKPRITGKNR